MTHPIAVVFAKETRDNLRDRRSLLSALIYPLLGPLVIAAMLFYLSNVVANRDAVGVTLPVMGAEHAPGLVERLTGQGYRIVPAPADVEAAVREGRQRLAVVIRPAFEAEIAAGRSGTVVVVTDHSRLETVPIAYRLVNLLEQYGRELAERRMVAHGLAVDFAAPVRIDNVKVSRQLQADELLLSMIPPFMIFTLFIGGVYLAIDSISGERERGSFEPLLANPVPRWHFLMGKALAAALFTMAAVVMQVAGFLLVIGANPGLFSHGSRFDLAMAASFVPLLLPMLVLAVGIQMLVAILTKSFKEAQTWLGLLPLVPAVPGMAMAMAPAHAKAWISWVPLLSQTSAMQRMIRGDTVPLADLLAGGGVTLALAAGILVLAAARMNREDIIFGTQG